MSCCRVHQVDYAPFLSLTWQIVIWVKKSVTLMTSVWLYTLWCFLNFPGFFLIQINGRGKHFSVTKCNLGFPWPRQRSLCGFRMGKHLPPPLMSWILASPLPTGQSISPLDTFPHTTPSSPLDHSRSARGVDVLPGLCTFIKSFDHGF